MSTSRVVVFFSQHCNNKEVLIKMSSPSPAGSRKDDPQMMLKMPYKSVRIAVGNFHCHSSRLRVVGSLEPVTFVLSEALKRVPKVSYHHEAFIPLTSYPQRHLINFCPYPRDTITTTTINPEDDLIDY